MQFLSATGARKALKTVVTGKEKKYEPPSSVLKRLCEIQTCGEHLCSLAATLTCAVAQRLLRHT